MENRSSGHHPFLHKLGAFLSDNPDRLFFLLLLYLSISGKKVVIENISKYSTKKTSAFEQYKSQLTIVNPLQKKPVLTNNRLYRILKRYEFFIKE